MVASSVLNSVPVEMMMIASGFVSPMELVFGGSILAFVLIAAFRPELAAKFPRAHPIALALEIGAAMAFLLIGAWAFLARH